MKKSTLLSGILTGALALSTVFATSCTHRAQGTRQLASSDFKIPPPPTQLGLQELQTELAELRKKPESVDRWIQESKVLFHTAKQFQSTDKAKAIEIHSEGRELAKKIIVAAPQNPWGLIWWCANAGKVADLRRNLSSLGIVSDAEDYMIKAKELNPELDSRLPYRALGRLYDVAPSFVSVGSSKKARENLEAAYAKYPEHPSNQIYLADFLLHEGGDENLVRARQLAIDTLTNPKLNTYRYEALDWYEMAVEIIQKTQPKP